MTPQPPSRISRLQLSQIRTFEKVDLAFEGDADRGQWIIFLGNNGAGKSTILKAIALALAPFEATMWALADPNVGGFIRWGNAEGAINVDVSTQDYPVVLRSTGVHSLPSSGPDFPHPFLVSYGSLRGTGLSSKSSQSGKSTERIASLFLPVSELVDPVQWLIQRKLRSTESEEGHAEFNALAQCICDLLPDVETLEVTSSGVEAVFENGVRERYSSLSDGYLTTLAWAIDMLAAWINLNPGPYEKPINELMTGFVLVDEIDLHLHPIWQRDIVDQIRSTFPNLSFIVTTHSPLTILSAKPGELYVVDQIANGEPSTVSRVDLRPGDVSDILTGSWFKIRSTLDADTERLMEEHRQLLSEGGNLEEIHSLETELRKRLNGFGGSSVDRVAQSMANEVIADQIRPLTETEKVDAKAKLKSMLGEKAL